MKDDNVPSYRIKLYLTHIDGVQELKFHYSLVKIPSIRRIVEPWKYKFKSKEE